MQQHRFETRRLRRGGRLRRWSAVAIVAAIGLLAASCGGSSNGSGTQAATDSIVAAPTVEADAGPVQEGGLLVYGLAAETSSLNPNVGQWTVSGYTEANAIYDPLAALGVDGKVEPYLAESFTSNADFTEWTIRLREGIRFQNGEPLDAAAVKLNFELMAKSALAGAVFVNLTELRTPDDRTVQLVFSKPWSTFPSTLILQPGYMAAPAMLLAPDPASADPIGTGPFVFTSRVQGEKLRVVKNEDYWRDGLPHLAEIEFRVITDSTSRGAALAAGDVDMIEVLDSTLLKTSVTRAESGEIQLLTSAGQEADESVIALNTTTAPFDDLVARQALAYAIDQEAIAQIAYDGMYPAAWGNFEEGSRFYIDREAAGYPAPDPGKARELADQYEREHGQPLAFTFKVGSDPLTRESRPVHPADAERGRHRHVDRDGRDGVDHRQRHPWRLPGIDVRDVVGPHARQGLPVHRDPTGAGQHLAQLHPALRPRARRRDGRGPRHR